MFNYLLTHKSKKYIEFVEVLKTKNDINAKENKFGFTVLMIGNKNFEGKSYLILK